MRLIKDLILIIFVCVIFPTKAFCYAPWINDTRAAFLNNNTIIYALNIRTFNANDKNGNGIIEENLGEERGTFLNAINRLDELKGYGINTILLLPVTPVGKIKALGTAGSLFSASSFNEINPQFKSRSSKMSVDDEMKIFINECHQRQLKVIVDLPACGAYDLYLKHPELFKKDKNQNPIVPADWTDVRLLDAGSEELINQDVYNLYAEFVDLMINLNVDGLRADEANMKPFTFWKKLIEETRARDPQFLFLAETSDVPKKASAGYTFTPTNKLLDAGFDGYYGNYSNLKNWINPKGLYAAVQSDLAISKKYTSNKKVLGNFATHDQISPILVNGIQFSKMIAWLNSTLPLNAYYVDGFPTGDNYIYSWANKKAYTSFTDDDYYFAHRGQMDIFNFSRRLIGGNHELFNEFIIATRVKTLMKDLISNGNFVPLKCSSTSIFAYGRSYNKDTLIVIGNLDFKKSQTIKVKIPRLNDETIVSTVKISSNFPKIEKGGISLILLPGEVQVFYLNSFELK